LIEFDVVVPNLNSGSQEALTGSIRLDLLARSISARIGLIVKVSEQERHKLLSILLLRTTKKFEIPTLGAKMA
jgi:hypothetical protein